MKIEDIILRRIIDSRGNPTVEAEIKTKNGVGIAAAPQVHLLEHTKLWLA